MARTELDVANEALHALQESPITSLTEEGKIPEALAFSLPIARRTVLQMHDWTAARKRAALVEITEESPGVPVVNYSGRAYVYSKPDDCLQIVDVISPLDQSGVFWIQEGLRIYTDTENAVVVYTVDVEDPAEWDDLLASAVAYMLASRVAYTITGDRGQEQVLMQTLGGYLSAAKRQSYGSARQRRAPSDQWAEGLFDAELRR